MNKNKIITFFDNNFTIVYILIIIIISVIISSIFTYSYVRLYNGELIRITATITDEQIESSTDDNGNETIEYIYTFDYTYKDKNYYCKKKYNNQKYTVGNVVDNAYINEKSFNTKKFENTLLFKGEYKPIIYFIYIFGASLFIIHVIFSVIIERIL